jgi:hypothetical protein
MHNNKYHDTNKYYNINYNTNWTNNIIILIILFSIYKIMGYKIIRLMNIYFHKYSYNLINSSGINIVSEDT